MRVIIHFYSYFKELAGCSETAEVVSEQCTLGALIDRLTMRYPRLDTMKKSALVAVGVEYQPRDYVLKAGDEVSLFPPVQGG